MKIPDKIKIGGHSFAIKFPYKFRERVDIFGQCDHPKKEIRISGVDSGGTARAESAVLVTVIHEVLHGLDATLGHEMFVETEGEKQCDALSEGIFQVLIDNGWIELDG